MTNTATDIVDHERVFCGMAFEYVRERAARSSSHLHLTEFGGDRAKVLRLPDGEQAIVYEFNGNSVALGLRCASSSKIDWVLGLDEEGLITDGRDFSEAAYQIALKVI